MQIVINEQMDLSIHMGMILGLTETIQESLVPEKELKHIWYSVWLLRIYLEQLNKLFNEQHINID